MTNSFSTDKLKSDLKRMKKETQIRGEAGYFNAPTVTIPSVAEEISERTLPVATVVPREVKRRVPKFPKGGVGPNWTKHFMPWVEQFWHEKKRYPSNAEFIDRFGIELVEVQKLNVSKFWIKSLERRGIKPPDVAEDFLSPIQIAAITLLTNFHDTRSPVAKMASIGVTTEQLNGWYQNNTFKNALRNRSDEILDHVEVDANVALATLIKKQDMRAIKFYFEITGKSQTPEQLNVQRTMQILIEAVQKHVKDESVLEAIANEVQAVRAIGGL